MTHQQILDKIGEKHLIRSVDEDLTRLIQNEMTAGGSKSIKEHTEIITAKLLLRWDSVLKTSDKDISEYYKQKTHLVLAVLLHKYGYKDEFITSNAIKAIDKLNKNVVLSDDFFRKSEDIKKLIKTEAIQLRRKPTVPENITFYRPKDIVSIELENKFYGAYIHAFTAPNESPVIEFYDAVFDKQPTIEELKKCRAKGALFKDGTQRVQKYSVNGMKFLPDPANQIKLISACENEPPSNNHLEQSLGLYAMKDIFSIQKTIKLLFKQ